MQEAISWTVVESSTSQVIAQLTKPLHALNEHAENELRQNMTETRTVVTNLGLMKYIRKALNNHSQAISLNGERN